MSSLLQGVKINGEEINLRGKIKLIYIDPPFATGADFSYSLDVPKVWMKIANEKNIKIKK